PVIGPGVFAVTKSKAFCPVMGGPGGGTTAGAGAGAAGGGPGGGAASESARLRTDSSGVRSLALMLEAEGAMRIAEALDDDTRRAAAALELDNSGVRSLAPLLD